MHISNNKKGIGIPIVLGIVTFVIATVATLLTVVVNQSKIIDKSIESTEAYANAVQSVDATLKIIARDRNLDSAYLDALELYMGVSIEAYGNSLYMISSMVTTSKAVTGYITGSLGGISIYDELFSSTVLDPTSEFSEFITPTTLLASYLPTFMDTELPGIAYPDEFLTFDSIVGYIETLANSRLGYIPIPNLNNLQSGTPVTGHWFVSGNVNMANGANLEVRPGYLLVIKGSLIMNNNSAIVGNVVVRGNVEIRSNNNNNTQRINGTIYAKGTVSSTRKIVIGDSRPAFVFSESNITFSRDLTGTGYFLCDAFSARFSNVHITGGVYADSILPSNLIISTYANLDKSLFYGYAIPDRIATEGDNPENIEFIYTFPKLN